jgi:hypothetical protein
MRKLFLVSFLASALMYGGVVRTAAKVVKATPKVVFVTMPKAVWKAVW